MAETLKVILTKKDVKDLTIANLGDKINALGADIPKGMGASIKLVFPKGHSATAFLEPQHIGDVTARPFELLSKYLQKTYGYSAVGYDWQMIGNEIEVKLERYDN